jgi:hypothetical protein
MKKLMATGLCLIVLAALVQGGQKGSTQAGDLEQELRQYMDGSAEYLVVIDKGNTFWAIPTSGIKSVDKNKVYLKGGTTVAMKKPAGAFDEKEFAGTLINELSSSSSESLSFTLDRNGNLASAGSTKTVRDNAKVEVKKIVPLSDR